MLKFILVRLHGQNQCCQPSGSFQIRNLDHKPMFYYPMTMEKPLELLNFGCLVCKELDSDLHRFFLEAVVHKILPWVICGRIRSKWNDDLCFQRDI